MGFRLLAHHGLLFVVLKKWEPLFMSKFDFQISLLNMFSVVNIYQKTKKVIRYGQYWGKIIIIIVIIAMLHLVNKLNF